MLAALRLLLTLPPLRVHPARFRVGRVASGPAASLPRVRRSHARECVALRVALARRYAARLPLACRPRSLGPGSPVGRRSLALCSGCRRTPPPPSRQKKIWLAPRRERRVCRFASPPVRLRSRRRSLRRSIPSQFPPSPSPGFRAMSPSALLPSLLVAGWLSRARSGLNVGRPSPSLPLPLAARPGPIPPVVGAGPPSPFGASFFSRLRPLRPLQGEQFFKLPAGLLRSIRITLASRSKNLRPKPRGALARLRCASASPHSLGATHIAALLLLHRRTPPPRSLRSRPHPLAASRRRWSPALAGSPPNIRSLHQSGIREHRFGLIYDMRRALRVDHVMKIRLFRVVAA